MRFIYLACTVLAAATAAAAADDYPSRPIRLLVGFPAGSALDSSARALASRLPELLGQNIVIDNRPGAAGTIASEMGARARPDGYTLLMAGIGSMAINPNLYDALTYRPLKDFVPISKVVNTANILALHPAFPANSVAELVALAKHKRLQAGSSGIGSPGHLGLELFNVLAGIKIEHVPYKGSGAALIDLIAGSIHVSFATAATVVPHMKAGRLKGLAVTTSERSRLLPDMPTMAEAGVKGFEVNGWHAMFAPAGTPDAIVQRLNLAVARILDSADVRHLLLSQGMEASPMSSEACRAMLRTELDRWSKVIKQAGIHVR